MRGLHLLQFIGWDASHRNEKPLHRETLPKKPYPTHVWSPIPPYDLLDGIARSPTINWRRSLYPLQKIGGGINPIQKM